MNENRVKVQSINELIDPLTVLNNSFELLRHRFQNTMDSFALEEFARIQRSLEKLTQEVERMRTEQNHS